LTRAGFWLILDGMSVITTNDGTRMQAGGFKA
jgi:hypothetical protein